MMKTRLCPVGRGSRSIFFTLAGWPGRKGREERGGAGRTGGCRIGSRGRPGVGRGGPGDRGMRGFRRLAPLCIVSFFHLVTNEVGIRFR